MNTIKINGVTIQGDARNIVVNNGEIIIDGVNVTPEAKEIKIEIDGNIDSLKADRCSEILVHGEAQTIQTQSGQVSIGGDVKGSITTMSGSINCGNVAGSIQTMSGSVRHL